ncbi:MAG TPA: trypsin-like peptidase domain-containing protein [Clostridia bacterium]|nr:trypsin-like peptidase domain-containing protein [Clostridia bacterium]
MSQVPDPYQPIPLSPEGTPPAAGYWVPPPTQPPPLPPRGGEPHLWRWIVVSVLVAALAAGGSGVGVGLGLANAFRPHTVVQSPLAIAPNAGNNGNLDANAIAAKVDPAIVDINTVVGTGQAAGTGEILTADGEVLTNNHVVDESTSIQVTIAGHNGVTYPAHVIGVAPAQDVALIQIEGVSGLPTVTLASSASLKVGDQIVALGNALGLGGTPAASSGTITALDQTITASEGGSNSEQLTGMIESNAPISPGDSGGPLVNSSGQVVGMITAGDVTGFRSQTSTVNYAIPSDTVLTYVNLVRAGQPSAGIIYGQVGLIGVQVRDVANSAVVGATVVAVVVGSPAETAGITAGSVITKIGDTKVANSAALGVAIRSHRAGEQVSVTWTDARGAHTATVTLGGVNP